MNSRRKISNVIKKEGFDNMYEVVYVHNKDKRGHNYCTTVNESVRFTNGIVEFCDKKRIQKMSRILDTPQKELIELIKKKIEEL